MQIEQQGVGLQETSMLLAVSCTYTIVNINSCTRKEEHASNAAGASIAARLLYSHYYQQPFVKAGHTTATAAAAAAAKLLHSRRYSQPFAKAAVPLPLLLSPLLLAHRSGFRLGMVSVGERSASSPHSSSMLVVCRGAQQQPCSTAAIRPALRLCNGCKPA
jgi:hypothetical protein